MKLTLRRLGLTLFLAIVFLGCRQAIRTSHDVINLVEGEELVGSLERISADSVWFKTDDGVVVFARSDVKSLDLPQPREGEEWQTVNDVDDPLLKEIIKNFEPPEVDVRYINLYVGHDFILHRDGTFEKRMRVIRYITAESGKGIAANNTWNYLADRAYARLDFARSISPEGRVIHINEAAINRVSLHPAPAEYSNLTQIQIAVPESRVGSILDFQFSTVQNVADSIHPIYAEVILADRQPTMVEVVSLRQPDGGPIEVFTSSDLEPKKEKKKGDEILTWIIQDQQPLRVEYNTPPAQDYLPRFIIANKKDWQTISVHLKGNLTSVSESERVIELADSLTQGLRDTEEKARALYTFVADNIRPLQAPSLNIFSYVPTPTDEVLTRGFANELDRAALLYALMKSAGLEVDLVYTRDRETGQLVPIFPALGQLNDAMVLFEDRVWLDPIHNIPFGTIFDQDAMGLSLASGKLKKIPLNTPAQEATLTTSSARLNSNGTLTMTMDAEYKSQNSALWKLHLKNMTPAELKQEAQELAADIHPNASLESFEFKGIKPLNEEISYQLKINIPSYATRAGDYLIFYLPGVEHSAYFVGALDRIYPIDRMTRSADIYELTLNFPPGSELIYTPENVSESNPYDSYTAAFDRLSDTKFKFTQSIEVLNPLIPPGDYEVYKELVEHMARLSQRPLVLRLK